MSAKTLYEKLVESHTIRELDNEGHVLLYIDRSILNEYTSPQAFSGLRERGRTVRHPDTFLLNIDHVNPTRSQRDDLMTDPEDSYRLITFGKMPLTLASHYLMYWIRVRGLNTWLLMNKG